jgi:hypothetical protein
VRVGDRVLAVQLHDISAGGLLAVGGSGAGLSAADRVQVELDLADGPLRLPSQVVRVGGSAGRSGDLALKFVDLPAGALARLKRRLAELEQETSGRAKA